MLPTLEHVNMTVTDIDREVRFFITAFPEFTIRGEGISGEGDSRRRWVHIGTEDSYIAIEQALRPPVDHETYRQPGINHLGFEVKDIEETAGRLRDAGYEEGMSAMNHPHRKRIYFYDPDGNEFEFIEYLSSVISERNDYSL